MATPKSRRITVSLSEAQFVKIEAIAKNSDASVSWVVRLALKKLLDAVGSKETFDAAQMIASDVER